ncbi:hypothetical protein CJF32_00010550 [Rutstroemia sp. NJR-2017a WRK4]|nr:hypothetical protein CJF32_00010550 [Rutstroemia sp. NJR-2017a WRK4]
MIQRIFYSATVALSLLSEVSATNKYSLVDNYEGVNFFEMFDFYTGKDPTSGFVSYTSKEVAENPNSDLGVALVKTNEYNQSYMGVDYVNVVTTGRPSVRIQSKKTYTQALIIADLAHMPASICGTWPAFWTVNTTNYPQYGEIDILENINEKTVSLQTLHTGDGCYISGNQYSNQLTDNITSYNCNDKATSSIFGAQDETSACSGTNTDPNSYGTTFNAAGGGVYAMQWTSEVIRMWNFAAGSIPADITAGTPDPATWKTPSFTTEGGVCNIDELFANHQIIFDTTFCGGYAGQTGFWQETTCYDATKYPTCNSYVAANPEAYKEAYWLINSVKVYQNATAPVSSTASATSTVLSAQPTTQESSTTATVEPSSASKANGLLNPATSEVASVASSASSVASSIVPSVVSSIASQETSSSAIYLISGETTEVASQSTSSPVYLVSGQTTEVPTESSATLSSLVPAETSTEAAVVPVSHTTSTIYGTNTRTISSCSAAATICDELGSVVTETVILSTTICPITATETPATQTPATQTPALETQPAASSGVQLTTTIHQVVTSTKLASTIYRTITVSGEGSTTTILPEETPQATVIPDTIVGSPASSLSLVASLTQAASTPEVTPSSSDVVILQTATVIPVAMTTSTAEGAYIWSTATSEGTSTAISNPLSSPIGAIAQASSDVSGETVNPTGASSSPLYLLSGQTTAQAAPVASAAESSTSSISAQGQETPSPIYSTATLIPTPAAASSSAQGISISIPQSSLPATTTQATSFMTLPTSSQTISSSNSTSSIPTPTLASGITSTTGTGILAETGSTETFTFAMPSAYSATGTSDSATSVTAYPYVNSGVGKVSVSARTGMVVSVAAVLLGLLI